VVVNEWELRVGLTDPRSYSLVKISSHGPYWLSVVWASSHSTGVYEVKVAFSGTSRILDVLYG
jgi:hypothetical protein